MNKIIKVVVDLPLKKLDKEFDYLIDKKFESIIQIGQVVKVPFGRRKISAFVTQIDVSSDLKRDQLKNIDSIIHPQALFDQKLLSLFHWISKYYHAYLAQVIKAALPAGVTDKIKKKKIECVKSSLKINKLKKKAKKLEKRAPKQFLILKYIIKNNSKQIKLADVLEYAQTSRQTVYRLIDKEFVKLYSIIEEREPKFKDSIDAKTLNSKLSKFESNQIKKIFNNKNKNKTFLLKSGYNRRYQIIVNLITKLLAEKKNVILLVPEIEKDYIFLKQLKNIFSKKIAFIHSKLTKGEFFDQWQQINTGQINLAVGARSAIFSPFTKVDAVIIMEENNGSYKQQEHPLYHVRQVAAKRLRGEESLLILESPMPSIESSYLADQKKYKLLDLQTKVDKIDSQIIDMKKEVEAGNLSNLSEKLSKEIRLASKKNNKIILFLNRRGSANYVICRKCGDVLQCENCNISLNYYEKEKKLRCHHCNFVMDLPDECPSCGSPFISPAGLGTEKLLREVKKRFKGISAARVDSTFSKQVISKKLDDFKKGKINILISTSIIFKNQFFDKLKFIAVVSADTALNSSNFRAAENNYFILKELKSLVLNSKESKIFFQSYQPQHRSLKAVADNNDKLFYQKETQIRRIRNYPPFSRLLNIIISSEKEKTASQDAKKLNEFLNKYSNKYNEKIDASPAILSKIRKKYRWQIILKFCSNKNREYIIRLIEDLFIDQDKTTEIRIDVDPYQML